MSKPEYNPTLMPLRRSRTGNFSWKVQPDMYDAFQKHVEVGCKILVKINNNKSKDESPDAYLEVIPKSKVTEYEATLPPRETTGEESPV